MTAIDVIIQIAASFLGSFGFGFLFNCRGKKLIFCALGGMWAWALFLLLGLFIDGEVIRYFIVSVAVSLYSEILARLLKSPSGTFSILSLIPLIPGGALYYAADYAIQGETELFIDKALYTFELTVALSLGIVLVTAIARFISAHAKKRPRALAK